MSYISKWGRLSQARAFVDRIRSSDKWYESVGISDSTLTHSSGNLYLLVGYDEDVGSTEFTSPVEILDDNKLCYYKIDFHFGTIEDGTNSEIHYCIPEDLVKWEAGISAISTKGEFLYGGRMWAKIDESVIFNNDSRLEEWLSDVPHWVHIDLGMSSAVIKSIKDNLEEDQKFNCFSIVERMVPQTSYSDSRIIPCLNTSKSYAGDSAIYNSGLAFHKGYPLVTVYRDSPISLIGAGVADLIAFSTIIQF